MADLVGAVIARGFSRFLSASGAPLEPRPPRNGSARGSGVTGGRNNPCRVIHGVDAVLFMRAENGRSRELLTWGDVTAWRRICVPPKVRAAVSGSDELHGPLRCATVRAGLQEPGAAGKSLQSRFLSKCWMVCGYLLGTGFYVILNRDNKNELALMIPTASNMTQRRHTVSSVRSEVTAQCADTGPLC